MDTSRFNRYLYFDDAKLQQEYDKYKKRITENIATDYDWQELKKIQEVLLQREPQEEQSPVGASQPPPTHQGAMPSFNAVLANVSHALSRSFRPKFSTQSSSAGTYAKPEDIIPMLCTHVNGHKSPRIPLANDIMANEFNFNLHIDTPKKLFIKDTCQFHVNSLRKDTFEPFFLKLTDIKKNSIHNLQKFNDGSLPFSIDIHKHNLKCEYKVLPPTNKLNYNIQFVAQSVSHFYSDKNYGFQSGVLVFCYDNKNDLDVSINMYNYVKKQATYVKKPIPKALFVDFSKDKVNAPELLKHVQYNLHISLDTDDKSEPISVQLNPNERIFEAKNKENQAQPTEYGFEALRVILCMLLLDNESENRDTTDGWTLI